MADIYSKRKRSDIMARVRGKDTLPEITARALLREAGFKIESNSGRLPAKPDLVLPDKKAVVFVHGCFWHQHKGCKRAKLPATNRRFWTTKLTTNARRDRRDERRLRRLGWSVHKLWECQLRSAPEVTVSRLMSRLRRKGVVRRRAEARAGG